MSAMPVPQPMSATLAPALSLATTPSRRGSAKGTSMVRNQGAEHAFHAARALRPEGVVGQADAGLERFEQLFEHAELLRQRGERAGGKGRAVRHSPAPMPRPADS